MANVIKKLFGIAAKEDANGGFTPSQVALKLATESKTDYDNTTYPNSHKNKLGKILLVCTEERYMPMKNGLKFSTGNHPVEMMVPMLHLEKAGFEFDICTPTGKAVAIEMWAMPNEDKAVKEIYQRYLEKFENPISLNEFVNNSMTESDYVAVFLPGGHGAMLGLPENIDLKKLIQWVHDKDRYMLAICHGPAALLAASLDSDKSSFLYRGYKMAVFPDELDKQTPIFGYMPGHMPWHFGEKLRELGVEIINKKANGACYQDRKLITGDSPKAANEFGKMSAMALIKELS